MKKILLAFVFFVVKVAQAEGYFELKFRDGSTIYHGLLLYYDDASPLNKMRIFFGNAYGEKILIEQNIRIEYSDSLGNDYRIMHGYNVKIITDSRNNPTQYFPDKFIFKRKGKQYYEPDYAISNMDEQGVVKGRFTYFKEITAISKKQLRKFGWGEPYGKSTTFLNSNGNNDPEYAAIAPSRLSAIGSSNVIFEPLQWTSNDNLERDFSKDTIHLIVISNTNDPDLGTSCQRNEAEIDKYFSSVVLKAGGKLHKVIINGNNFNLSTIEASINNLSTNKNSGVILYYSGHGFRPVDLTDSLPILDLRSNTLVDEFNATNTKSLRDVYQTLKNKQPRFCIVIAECCNNEINVQAKQLLPNNPPQSLQTASSGLTIRTALAKKLLEYEGSLLIATASPRQLTYYYPEKGGVFCKNLRDRMHAILLYSENPNDADWLEFFRYSATETEKYLKSQDGAFTQIPIWVY